MITAKSFNGKPIISITDGKNLGSVKDIYLDQDIRHMVGVYLGTEGLVRRKDKVVLSSAVQVLGVDVWLVSGSEIIVDKGSVPEGDSFVQAGNLRGREIATDGGTRIGVIEDVLMDDDATVLGFSMSKVYAQGPLAERKAVIREAILNLGSKDTPMVVDLTLAEAGIIS